MPSLEEAFPENPLVSSIQWPAFSKQPFTIPWSRKYVPLGTGVLSAQIEGSNPLRRCALQPTKGLLKQSISAGSLVSTSTNANSSASEHLVASFGASVGTKYLNASVKGNYEKGVQGNHDDIRQNLRAEHCSGSILLNHSPQLCIEALEILRKHPEPTKAFEAVYGDYYVGALYVGASNGTMLSGSSAFTGSQKAWSASLTGKVLFVKKTWTKSHSESSSSFGGAYTLNAYDTLEDIHHNESIGDASNIQRLGEAAGQNRIRGMAVQARVKRKLNEYGNWDQNQALTEDECRRLCDSGVVFEVLLIPYASVRDYVQAIAQRYDS